MADEFEVFWTQAAVRDLEDIVSYIAWDSPTNAKRVLRRLRRQGESLTHLPLRGRVVPELGELGIGTWRELVVPPHRLIYRVAGSTVLIEVVLDSRRDADTLLQERLLRD